MAFDSSRNHESPYLFRQFTVPGNGETFNSFRPSTIVLRNPTESIPNDQLSQFGQSISNVNNSTTSTKESDSSSSSSSNSSTNFTDIDSSKPVSPIDLDIQEKIKLERKRQRNRTAASKCRKKKLEKISRLHQRVVFLRKDNSELTIVRNQLRDNVTELKEQIMRHLQFGCNVKFTSINEGSGSYHGNSNLVYGKR